MKEKNKPNQILLGYPVSEGNPFKSDVEQFQKAMRPSSRSITSEGYRHTKITVIEQTEYFPGSFSKLYQNVDLLDNLSPEACKILIFIASRMQYNNDNIKISQRESGLSRRTFPRAIVELLTARIIAKGRIREWYWVNVTLLIVGNINKHGEENSE